jgi:biotin carboxyl carrier protein
MTSLLTRTRTDTSPSVIDPPSSSLAGTVAEDLVLVVAPATGRFRPSGIEAVAPGHLLGHVTGGQGRADAVVAPAAGAVARLLVRPNQLVMRGQGLVWLRRSAG